jgi:DNA/RNA-binding domain of Phe-tRNA-synthetase-like protein
LRSPASNCLKSLWISITWFQLESLNPAGRYDLEKITPPIELRIGAVGENYKGIGKDLINIENLPVFADANGAFGSPISDSERGIFRMETRKVLMVVFSFTGPDGLPRWVERASNLLRQYGTAQASKPVW